jgi:hypothetical protein
VTPDGNANNRVKLQIKEDSPLNTGQVFKDDPLFLGTSCDPESDAFKHEAFADTVYELIKANQPPLSIGLFGSWGIGKSTIVNILFGKLNERDSASFKTVYFNAWKYSGDSFRRQFLIEVATQIHGPRSEKVSRLQRLNYVDVLKRPKKEGLGSELVEAFKESIRLKFRFRPDAVARFLLGCLTLFVVFAIGLAVSKVSTVLSAFIISLATPAVFLWLANIKFDELFVFQEAPMYDPKLIFPEQFEKEFADLISNEALGGKKAVIAIDDLDRCESRIVQDVLISLKNFTGHKNCFFLVPCDDKTIVQIFSEPNQKLGYKDESLRKYFNVGIRIPPIQGTDLVDFANSVTRTTGIPGDIVQMAVLANCRDARKMKHFLNGFIMKYRLAKAREAAGQMPPIVTESLLSLAKTVLIEDAYPDLFARIVETPRIYQALVRAALGSADGGELKQLGLDKWEEEFPGLKEILNLPANAISNLFVETLEVNQDESLKRWLQMFSSHQELLDVDFHERLVTKAIELVNSGRFNQVRSEILLRAMTNSLAKLAVEKRQSLIQKYFEFLKHTNTQIRNAAAAVLAEAAKALSDPQELKIRLFDTLRFVEREVTDQQLISFRPVVEAVLTENQVFGTEEWSEASNLGRRLLASSDDAVREFGLAVVEKIPEQSLTLKQEIVHLLAGLETSGFANSERVRQKLNRIGETERDSDQS